jgi:peptidyl-prolyl cis-trans isomerase SurA
VLRKSISALFILFTCLICVLPAYAQQQGEIVDRILAVVDSEIILESEVLQYVQDIVLRNQTAYQDASQIEALRAQILEELINQKIMLAIAVDDTNIVVEDRQVDQTLDDRISQVARELGGEERLIEYYGKPVRQIRREFRKQVYDNLVVERVRSSRTVRVEVTRNEVEAYFKEHSAEFPVIPEQVEIAHILIPIKPSEEADNSAKSKADSLFNLLLMEIDFNQLAIENSEDGGSAPKGGLLGTTERGDLVPEYEEIAFGLEEGEVSQPIKTRFGYQIIRLNWRRGEKINTSHILITSMATSSDETRAISFANELRDRINSGEDFEVLAKEYSDDKETAPLGGGLGWFDVRNLPEEFKLASANVEVGDLSMPFKSALGIHLMKKLNYDSERQIKIEKDWERISQLAKMQKQDLVFKVWIAEQRKDVYIDIFHR